jgi:hypothetical protein
MEFLASDNERVTDFLSNQENHDFHVFLLNIIQHAVVADTQLELGEWIWAKALDGFGLHRWLPCQACYDRRLDYALCASRQRS